MLFLHIFNIFIALAGLVGAQQQQPKFTVFLDLDADDIEHEYLQCIYHIRDTLAEGADRVNNNIVVLNEQNDDNFEVFDLVVMMDNVNITLRYRTDNLYLLGYSGRTGDEGTWWEFGEDRKNRRFIPGSTFLGFGGGYPSLREQLDNKKDGIKCYQAALMANIATLRAAGTKKNNNELANALIGIIVMTAEAARFTPLLEWISQNFYVIGDLYPGLAGLVTVWRNLSRAVLNYFAGRGTPPEDRIALLPNALGIRTIQDAIERLALAVRPKDWPGTSGSGDPGPSGSRDQGPPGSGGPGPSGSGTGKRAVRSRITSRQTSAADFAFLIGRPLVEFYGVKLASKTPDGETAVRGTITTTDGLYDNTIFKRDSDWPEKLDGYDDITLDGPIRALSADDDWLLDVNLVDNSDGSDISVGQITWSNRDNSDSFNVLQSMRVPLDKQDPPYVTVTWLCVQNGAEGRVDIVPVDDASATGKFQIEGKIFTRTSQFPQTPAIVFDSTSNGLTKQAEWGAASLLRTVVVPMDAVLTVNANVWDEASSGESIAEGEVDFGRPKIYTSESQIIKGTRGHVEVRVTWL